jgi:hypothetical protein
MEKYIVIKAFSVLEKALLIPEDEVYAEEFPANRYRIFNIKTRKLIGLIGADKFMNSVRHSSDFKIYDNEHAKKQLSGVIDSMRAKTKSKLQKENYDFIKESINTIF